MITRLAFWWLLRHRYTVIRPCRACGHVGHIGSCFDQDCTCRRSTEHYMLAGRFYEMIDSGSKERDLGRRARSPGWL